MNTDTHTDQHHNLRSRINRIAGQVNGIQRMMENAAF